MFSSILGYPEEGHYLNTNTISSEALALLQTGKNAEAVALLTRHLEKTPNDDIAYGLLGRARYTLGDKVGAVDAFRRAAELDPNNSQHLYNLAVASRNTAPLSEVRTLLERALALTPDYPVAQDLLASLPVPYVASPAVRATPQPVDTPALRTNIPPIPVLGTNNDRPDWSVVNKWNWGAFLFGLSGNGFIWLWAHGGIGWGIGVFFAQCAVNMLGTQGRPMAILGLLINLSFCVWLGMTGGSFSYSNRVFVDPEDFTACHRIWMYWGIGLLLIGPTIAIILIISFLPGLIQAITSH